MKFQEQFTLVSIFSLLFLLFSFSSYAQTCDPALAPAKNKEKAYQMRGSRCEGFYLSKVSAGSLSLVGFFQGKRLKKTEKDDVITVSPIFPQQNSLHVRAVGTPMKTYYRMDAVVKSGKNLPWPAGEVLSNGKLSMGKVGVFAWIEKSKRKIYIPISLISSSKTTPKKKNTSITALFRPSVSVGKTRWRYAAVAEDGQCGKWGKWKNSKKKSYRSGNVITVVLSSKLSGEWCLRIVAKEKKGNRWLKKNIRLALGKS